VTGAVVYGYPEGRTHPFAHEKTEQLLDFAFDRLSMQPGPRFMAGDWNFAPEALQVSQKLSDAGWVEVQNLWRSQTGADIQMTCKQVSHKDFLWISPELALGFQPISVDHHVFADHSVLIAHFAGGRSQVERFVWPCPKPVPWTQLPPLEQAVDFASPLDPTQQYADLWRCKEALAKAHLGAEWMPSMQGRGQQTQPRRTVGCQAPLKQGRSQDVQPAFFGFSAIHAKQFKQVRRLQNYCRWVDNRTSHTAQDMLHGVGLWNSILKATGFWPSFQSWWPGRQYVCPLDPAHIPVHCPSSAVAHQIYDAVLAEVRLLEQRLVLSKQSYRHARHERDKHLIFREVARTPAAPVETLVHRVDAVVTQVDVDESAVELDKPVECLPSEPLWISGVAHDIIHADHDKVWIEDVSGISPQDKVVQSKHVGDLRAIFQAFHEQWKIRWCRHDQVPFTHWAELIAFARRVINPSPIPHLSVDAALLQAEGFKKKKKAATGLDGVSRLDIVQADHNTLHSLAQLYLRAEADGSWPAQLVAGKVQSLAKTEHASTVGEYRPITVFGLPYRAWSSIQSRHLLQFADTWVDDSVYGNRRGRQASDLWAHLLQQIESAYASSEALSGVCADLEKCFNCIPRFPALCLAVLVGTPDSVTTAWAGALASMCRHFKVRDSYSDGFLTSTGLAEGCGLSVFGMLLVDHLFAVWMKVQAPSICCLTYVDDWQAITRDPQFAVRQLELVESFASMIDLTVDRKKTFGWSTCPEVRRALRDHGVKVLHHARELGGHLGVSRQYTNRTLTQRIADLDDFWSKLRSCRAGFTAKTFMLRAVAWPRGLHAVASAPVGDQIWVNLRRCAVKALGMQKPGVNPSVLLGLVTPGLDPQLTAVLWTFRSLRVHCPVDFWLSSVSPVAHGDLDLPPNSLASRLARMTKPCTVLDLLVDCSLIGTNRNGPNNLKRAGGVVLLTLCFIGIGNAHNTMIYDCLWHPISPPLWIPFLQL